MPPLELSIVEEVTRIQKYLWDSLYEYDMNFSDGLLSYVGFKIQEGSLNSYEDQLNLWS